MTEPEAEVLWSWACRYPSCVVEIGSWTGRGTVLLSHAVAEYGGRVHTIDPFDDSVGVGGTKFRPEVRRALIRNLSSLARPGAWQYHHARSSDVAARWGGPPVSMLWVDGDHTVKGTTLDWESWTPLLADDAVVALHDVSFPGPAAVVARATAEGWSVVEAEQTLVVLRR